MPRVCETPSWLSSFSLPGMSMGMSKHVFPLSCPMGPPPQAGQRCRLACTSRPPPGASIPWSSPLAFFRGLPCPVLPRPALPFPPRLTMWAPTDEATLLGSTAFVVHNLTGNTSFVYQHVQVRRVRASFTCWMYTPKFLCIVAAPSCPYL